jgi:hypothetical protein
LPLRYLVLIQGHKKHGFWSKVGPKPRTNKERGRLPASRPFSFQNHCSTPLKLYFLWRSHSGLRINGRMDVVLARINGLDYRPGRVATFEEFVERWKAEVLITQQLSSIRAVKSHLKCHIVPQLAKLPRTIQRGKPANLHHPHVRKGCFTEDRAKCSGHAFFNSHHGP